MRRVARCRLAAEPLTPAWAASGPRPAHRPRGPRTLVATGLCRPPSGYSPAPRLTWREPLVAKPPARRRSWRRPLETRPQRPEPTGSSGRLNDRRVARSASGHGIHGGPLTCGAASPAVEADSAECRGASWRGRGGRETPRPGAAASVPCRRGRGQLREGARQFCRG